MTVCMQSDLMTFTREKHSLPRYVCWWRYYRHLSDIYPNETRPACVGGEMHVL